jgi:hypothetical protein
MENFQLNLVKLFHTKHIHTHISIVNFQQILLDNNKKCYRHIYVFRKKKLIFVVTMRATTKSTVDIMMGVLGKFSDSMGEGMRQTRKRKSTHTRQLWIRCSWQSGKTVSQSFKINVWKIASRFANGTLYRFIATIQNRKKYWKKYETTSEMIVFRNFADTLRKRELTDWYNGNNNNDVEKKEKSKTS